MRVFIIGYHWVGGFSDFAAEGFRDNGCETALVYENELSFFQKARAALMRYPWLYRIAGILKKKTSAAYRSYESSRRAGIAPRIVRQAKRFKPDFILMIQCAGTSAETLRALRDETGVPIFAWFGDNPFNWVDDSYDDKWQFFDACFAVDATWLTPLRTATGKPAFHLPLASSAHAYFPVRTVPRRYVADIAFVGAPTEERIVHIKALSGCDIKIYGLGWDAYFEKYPQLAKQWQGPVSPKEGNMAQNGAKIVLGLYGKNLATSVGQRAFDAGASGSFFLSERKGQLTDLFPEGALALFDDPDDLRVKADYWLSHDEGRTAVAARFHSAVMHSNLYRHRAASVCEAFKSLRHG